VSARLKRRMVIAALVLGVAGLGGSALASSSSAGNSFFDDVARHLGITPAKLQTAINQAEADRLNQLVKQGRLTKAQAGAIEKRTEQHHGVPFGPFGGPFGTPFGGPHPFGNHHFRGHGPPVPFFFGSPMGSLQAAAGYLGISQQALGSDLRSGKTLAAIAKAKGKSVSGLEKAMLAASKTQLDSAGHGEEAHRPSGEQAPDGALEPHRHVRDEGLRSRLRRPDALRLGRPSPPESPRQQRPLDGAHRVRPLRSSGRHMKRPPLMSRHVPVM
jgi:AraC-like DNA-binding protein